MEQFVLFRRIITKLRVIDYVGDHYLTRQFLLNVVGWGILCDLSRLFMVFFIFVLIPRENIRDASSRIRSAKDVRFGGFVNKISSPPSPH